MNMKEARPQVKRQVVSGFIIFRRTHEGIRYLFLYKRGGYWNFPKGHFEKEENAMDTAFRETYEETGLKPEELKIIPGFKTYVRFHFFHGQKKIQDTMILYLAETKQVHVRIEPREHNGFAWLIYQDAMKMLGKYAGIKRALKEANDFIHKKSVRNHEQNTQGRGPNLQAGGQPRGQARGFEGGRQRPEQKPLHS